MKLSPYNNRTKTVSCWIVWTYSRTSNDGNHYESREFSSASENWRVAWTWDIRLYSTSSGTCQLLSRIQSWYHDSLLWLEISRGKTTTRLMYSILTHAVARAQCSRVSPNYHSQGIVVSAPDSQLRSSFDGLQGLVSKFRLSLARIAVNRKPQDCGVLWGRDWNILPAMYSSPYLERFVSCFNLTEIYG